MRDSQFHFLHKIWSESRQECCEPIDKLRTLAKHWLQLWGFKIIQIHAAKKHCLDHQNTGQLQQFERAAHVLSAETTRIFEVPRLRTHKTKTYQVSWWRTGQGRTDNAHILCSQNMSKWPAISFSERHDISLCSQSTPPMRWRCW